ncbi:hypothetical protein [Scale drop disease virus]|nr:hypothetical protein [Scale drop disease virus]QXJ13632.1 ORF042L [Scale drop disease virus]
MGVCMWFLNKYPSKSNDLSDIMIQLLEKHVDWQMWLNNKCIDVNFKDHSLSVVSRKA